MADVLKFDKERQRWVVYRKGEAMASSVNRSLLESKFPDAKERQT